MKTKEEILKRKEFTDADGQSGWTEAQVLNAMQEYADQETSSLLEQLKEKEEKIKELEDWKQQEIDTWQSAWGKIMQYLDEHPEAKLGCNYTNTTVKFMKERDIFKSQIESQSKLIESLKGAMDLAAKVAVTGIMLNEEERKLFSKNLTEYNNCKNKQNGKEGTY